MVDQTRWQIQGCCSQRYSHTRMVLYFLSLTDLARPVSCCSIRSGRVGCRVGAQSNPLQKLVVPKFVSEKNDLSNLYWRNIQLLECTVNIVWRTDWDDSFYGVFTTLKSYVSMSTERILVLYTCGQCCSRYVSWSMTGFLSSPFHPQSIEIVWFQTG